MIQQIKIALDLDETAAALSLGPSTIQKMVAQGDFPKPRQLAGRRVGWLLREVNDWAESRPASALLPPPNTGARKVSTTNSQASDQA